MGISFYCETNDDVGGYYQNLATELFEICGKLRREEGIDVESYLTDEGQEFEFFGLGHMIEMFKKVKEITEGYDESLFGRSKEGYLYDLNEVIADLDKFEDKNLQIAMTIA